MPVHNQQQVNAFTIEYNSIARMINSECGVSESFIPNGNNAPHPQIKKYVALWDTGATASVITQKVVDELKLKPTGMIKAFHAQGEGFVNTYLVNILLPNSVGFHSLQVTEGTLNGFDVLIGMDIISKGDLSLCNSDGKSIFSFQVPSDHKIDFVEEIEKKKHTPIIKQKAPERNKPCPCGSGKKYKHCCLKN